MPALLIAAPASGCGKTTLVAGLARALRRRGLAVATAKSGPDYIDPGFHAAASGRDCLTLDAWAMAPARLAALFAGLRAGADVVLVEGAMGLFDGAADGTPAGGAGSAADLAVHLGLPVLLVIDGRGMGASAGALAAGFARWRPDVRVGGVVLTFVAGEGHKELLAAGIAAAGLPVLGALRRDPSLSLPSRHLGLVPAGEQAALGERLDAIADAVTADCDLEAILALAGTARRLSSGELSPPPLPPLGQRIAIAGDDAFAFAYPHLLTGWRAAGAELLPFSPLADEAPDGTADAIYLPGGYPELHAGRLAAAGRFLVGLRAAAARGAAVFGECGGYMVLGQGLVDGQGQRHAMAGLLGLESSFAERRLALGYRRARTLGVSPLGPAGTAVAAHEFHYATVLATADAPLFTACDARGRALGSVGERRGTVAGSFLHVIDRA